MRLFRRAMPKRAITPTASTGRWSLFRKVTAATVAIGLVGGGLVLNATTATADVTMGGKVYLDYNGNGTFDATAGARSQDVLLGGITVTAYNQAGAVAGSAVTTVNATNGTGNYTLNASGVNAGDPLRLEFTNLPAGMRDTFNASQSGVQFVKAGDVVDYGVFDSSQYVPLSTTDPNPALATAINYAGLRTYSPAVSNQPAVVGHLWKTRNNTGGAGGTQNSTAEFSGRTTWATYGEVGSVYSLAADNATGDVYAAASYKRISQLGPQGLGGIYIIRGAVNPATGAPKTRSSLVGFDAAAILGGTNPFGTIAANGGDMSSVGNATARGLDFPAKMINDNDAFAKAGKVGIGGIAIDADEAILYLVNLNDKMIYAIDISAATPAGYSLIGSVDSGAGAGQRPFALTLHQGKLYVGYNDTGEATAWQSATTANMRYYVARTPALTRSNSGALSSFTAFTKVLDNGSLSYNKGNPLTSWGSWDSNGDNYARNYPQITRWNSWTDTWGNRTFAASQAGQTVGIDDTLNTWTGNNNAAMCQGVGTNDRNNARCNRTWGDLTQVYPQPLLSGITFDREGYMTLGIMDRSEFQGGNRNWAASSTVDSGSSTRMWESIASGDTLIAGPKRSSDNSNFQSWVPETNRQASIRTSTDTVVSTRTGSNRTQIPAVGEGPGGAEFFQDQQGNATPNHRENTLGSAIVVPGTLDEVATTSYDPLAPIRVQGVQWFSLSNGDRGAVNLNGYQETNDPGDPISTQNASNNTRNGFQKGGGMGGLTLIGKAAPVEIGNRTWLDLDRDGIQDADEPAIVGAKVTLFAADASGKPTGAAIATKNTAADGTYFFRSEGDGAYTFAPDGKYVVVFEPATGPVQLNWSKATVSGNAPADFVTPSWNQLAFTTPLVVDPAISGGTAEQQAALAIERDSNAVPSGDPAVNINEAAYAPVTIGTAGQNDHSIDAGWVLGTVTVGDFVWEDLDHDGIQDAGEPPIDGVLFRIYPVDGGTSRELTTDIFGNVFDKNRTVDGRYFFENLPVLTGPADQNFYRVVIDFTDPGTIAALTGFTPTLERQGSDRELDSNTDHTDTRDLPFGQELTVPGRADLSLDFGFFRPSPAATIVKNDGSNEADTPAAAVDLTTTGSAAGTTPLKFTIVNTGTDALHDVVVTDSVVEGAAVVTGLVCFFEPGVGTPGVYDAGTNSWKVTWAASLAAAGVGRKSLAVNGSFDCTATLTGVIGDHKNVATITGTGVTSGATVPVKAFDPNTPSEPGTDNPFHAKRTPSVSVGDRVWLDTNNDGLQDRDGDGDYTEPGIDGVVLKIVGPGGNPVKSVVTGLDVPDETTVGGLYTFKDLPVLPAGQSYTVEIVSVPAQYKPTTPGTNNGTGEWDSSEDSSVSQADLSTHGANDPTLDFGFVLVEPTATVIKTDGAGDTADTAATAVDVSPTGSTTIRFTILNPADAEEPLVDIGLSDATKGGTGSVSYPLSCALVSDATVTFSLATASATWAGPLAIGDGIVCTSTLTGVAAGGTHLNVVELNAKGALSGTTVLVENPDDPTGPKVPPSDPFNAKFPTYAIGDYVWIDSNGNGIQDAGEPAFADGTTVRLQKLDANGDPAGAPLTDTTDGNGRYLFDNLAAGQYRVDFELPTGYVWTTAGSTAGTADDSNAVWTTENQAWSTPVTITLGASSPLTAKGSEAGRPVSASEGIDQTWDAGIVRPVPNATVDKSDEDGETANDSDPVVDLGADGAIGIVFTITNTGAEPLTGISLADETTNGSGELQYPIVLTLQDGVSTFPLTSATATWNGVLGRGETITGRAQLTGVEPGETHRDEVTLNARGTLSGEPLVAPPTDEYNGRVPTYALGDYVWIDANRDGIQDAGEVPVGNVTVNLLDGAGNPTGKSTTTDPNGFYLFDELVAGDYQVEFELPAGQYRWTTSGTGNAASTNDSDAEWTNSDDAKATTRTISLGASSPLTPSADYTGAAPVKATEGIDPTWDAGLVLRSYAIGNVVWIDRDEDGLQGAGEPRLADVVVNLLNADGTPVLVDANGNVVTTGGTAFSTTTDGTGRYLFDGLPAGTYIVEFELPDGHRWTDANADDDENDSDAEWTTDTQAKARTRVITLGNGTVVATDPEGQTVTATEGIDPTWDAGVVPLKVSVGDFVWHDKDGDGTQNDGADSGIENVTLTLTVKRADGTEESVTDVWGQPVDPTDTDADGWYGFSDLPVLKTGEKYVVTISNVPPQYKPTIPGTNNGEGANDSSTGSATSQSLTTDGAEDLTLDFGFALKTPGATINKSDENGNDANTASEAADLGPSAGEVEIVFTIDNDGEEPLTNIGLVDASTGSGAIQYPIVLTLPGGGTFSLADEDARWTGQLAPGAQIIGRAMLTGVTTAEPHANTVTLWADGAFSGKPVVADPENPGDPDDPIRPSDPYHAVVKTYAIGDIVWIDRNKNGQQDNVGQTGGENPLAGVTVNLLDGAGAPAKDVDGNPVLPATTGPDGRYVFNDLVAGSYFVEFVLPDGYRFTTQNASGVGAAANSDANPATGRTGAIVLGNDAVTKTYADQPWSATEGIDPTWDAGVVPESVSVGDYVWHDLDANGTQDGGEPGIPGVTLTLTGPNGPVTNVYGEPVDPVQTDGQGKYLFTDLPVLGDGESYVVTISGVPSKFKPTTSGPNNGEGELDSSEGSATSGPLTSDGDEDPTLDFGFVLKTPGATITKVDAQDRDANDAATAADLSPSRGTIDITFTVVNNGGEPLTNIALVDETTAGSGEVQYPLVCTPPSGVEFELQNSDGSVWLVDGEPGVLAEGETLTCVGTLEGVVAHEPHTDLVTLFADGALTGKPVVDPENPGTTEEPNRPTDPYNAVVKTYAIGDFVWLDQLNPNGIQDAGEPGIAGVRVTLLDAAGTPVPGKSVTTGANGYYQFDELEPGQYQVKFDLPAGWTIVPNDQGSDDAKDSDAIATSPTSGTTILVTLDDTNPALVGREGVLATEGIDPTWDAGVRKYTFAIGDVVWIDRDADGIQDEGEPRIAGVVVNLLDGAGNPVEDAEGNAITTTTDGNGLYLFDELPQGSYIVEFELPEAYFWTTANATGDGATVENDSDAGHTTPTDAKARTGVIVLGNTAVDPDYDGQEFTASEGVDPTWDAGVIPATVSVGDLVWLDSDGDGLQDAGEPGIAGAVLTLTGPTGWDGKNVYGETVGPFTTLADGAYEFKDLPVLKPGESYTVSVVAPEKYLPTKPGPNNGEGPLDSSTGSATSGDLTENGAKDPTLDFGFVLKQPRGTVNKTDGTNDADTAEEAVDLGPAGGSTPIEITVTNTGEEAITDLRLADASTGTGELVYPLECTIEESDVSFELESATDVWSEGELPIGGTLVCTGTLEGVTSAEPHYNNVTLWAAGALTGDPVQDEENPGTPEDPNRPQDPYHAVVKTYAIGDIVWIDRDKDGQQDDDEKPLSGVKVNLLDAAGDPAKDADGATVPQATTDTDGRYLFDNLPAGAYIVEFVLPDGYRFTERNASGVPDGANSDAKASGDEIGQTSVITLGNGSVTTVYDRQLLATEGIDPTWDAGVVPESVTVGDFVWHDLDGDGKQGDEPGIPGVTLTLTGPNGPVTNVYGEPVQPVKTGPDGAYEFTDLPVLPRGSYTVTISEVPDKFKPTTPGPNNGEGSDDSSTGSATSGPLTKDGDKDLTLDFGFVLKTPGASVDKSDANQNPGDDASDPVDLSPTGKVGIVLTIVNNGEEPITRIGLNDASTGSGAISYPLQCVAPGGVEFTLDTPESFWEVEAPATEPETETEQPVEETTQPEAGDGEEAATESVDTGEESQDESGDQSGDEAGETEQSEPAKDAPEKAAADEPATGYGVLDVDGTIVCTTTLEGVTAGDPHQNVVTLWAEGALTGHPVQDPENPGTPEKPNRPTDPYNAVVKTYAIGDYVWIDADGDGQQGETEKPLKGVKVTLLDDEGSPVPGQTTETDEDGYYQFDELDPGKYQVRFELPRGYILTTPDQGADESDSDALPVAGSDGMKGETKQITLDSTNAALAKRNGVKATEGIDPTWDAGVRLAQVTVGDKVWKDVDRDGIQDPEEPGIPGVVLVIERTDGKPVTDVDGKPVDPQTTGPDGIYSFEKLPVLPKGESYVVKIDREKSSEALKNLVPTEPGRGGDPAKDSSTWEEKSSGLEKDGDEDKTLDFGFVVKKVTVGDRVWEDSNKNGVQDAGEPGIGGVVLKITGPDGEVTDVFGNLVAPVTTDPDGNYLFPDLPALEEGQSYTVTIDQEASAAALAGFQPTRTGQGTRATDSATDSDTTQGLTQDGDEDRTLDFGFIRPSVTVGDKVWKDSNRNGRQDKGEPGIKGVVLAITGPDGGEVTDVFGNPVAPVTTDGNGNYRFTDLPILPEGQSYTVTIDQEASKSALKGLQPTKSNVGDREGDSSEGSEMTQGLTADGDEDLTLDFGFITPPKPGELPKTGSDAMLPLGIGGLLIAAGAGLLIWRRRRRQGLVD